jgi:hypothetical protein
MKHTFIALIALIMLAMAPAQASMTITMANPDGTGQRDLLVYYANGSLQGNYNTTSIIQVDANSSYIFTLKPQGNNLIDDPGNWLTNYAFPYVRTNITAIIIIFACLAILFTRRR